MQRLMEAGVLCMWLVVAVAGPVRAQTQDPARQADIERLMDLTGTSTLGAQVATSAFDQMLSDLTRSQQNIPDRAVAAVKAVLSAELSNAFAAPEMRARQVAIYAEQFTPDEVKGLLVFYSTPAGRKASAVLPMLLQDGMAAGQEWISANVDRIGELIEARFRAEGVIR